MRDSLTPCAASVIGIPIGLFLTFGPMQAGLHGLWTGLTIALAFGATLSLALISRTVSVSLRFAAICPSADAVSRSCSRGTQKWTKPRASAASRRLFSGRSARQHGQGQRQEQHESITLFPGDGSVCPCASLLLLLLLPCGTCVLRVQILRRQRRVVRCVRLAVDALALHPVEQAHNRGEDEVDWDEAGVSDASAGARRLDSPKMTSTRAARKSSV